jgi:uncharacterized protein
MLTLDVNVLVDAFREDSPHHALVGAWLRQAVREPEPVVLFEVALSGFVRVVTHTRVFDPPTPIALALAFAEAMLAQPSCVVVRPGPRHWGLFVRLCRSSDARGNLVADAYLAALAMEAGCTLVTSDRDFARFAGLRWRPPGE